MESVMQKTLLLDNYGTIFLCFRQFRSQIKDDKYWLPAVARTASVAYRETRSLPVGYFLSRLETEASKNNTESTVYLPHHFAYQTASLRNFKK